MININLLPKHLRRVREPAYWRVIALLFPLLVFGVIGALQFSVIQTEKNKKNEVEQLQVRRQELQPFVQKRRELQAELQTLEVFGSLGNQIRQDQILWTEEIAGMLETLPAQGDAPRPRLSFNSLSMQAVVPPSSSPERFDGQTVKAEMTVSGEVINAEVLAEFIRTLEDSSHYDVDFQSASLQEETGFFNYSLTIASIAGNGADDEPQ